MNRTEWEASNDPLPMLDWLRERGSERKIRLFTCACLRHLESVYRDFDLEVLPAVEVGEAKADGRPAAAYRLPCRGKVVYSSGDVSGARDLLELVGLGQAWWVAWESVLRLSALLRAHAQEGFPDPPMSSARVNRLEAGAQAALLRDLFGHLFHEDHLWIGRLKRTDDAERLARAISEGHTFGDLPVLADALEEAGCADVAVLEHCREPGLHARGCWVIDALLGRS